MNLLQSYLQVFLFSIFSFGTCKCWRLSAKDMKKAIEIFSISNSSVDEDVKQTLDGKLYPEVDKFYYVCNRALLNFTKLVPSETKCAGYDCWKSQLTSITRFNLLNAVNKYREKVAKGICLDHCTGQMQLVTELRWNYVAEEISKTYAEQCIPNLAKLEEPASYPDGRRVIRETVGISFPMEDGDQYEIRNNFWRHIALNDFIDWDTGEEPTFRRGMMSEFGCAFVTTRTKTETDSEEDRVIDTGYLVCTYMTFTNQIRGKEGVATNEDCKNVAPEYEFDINPDNIYPALFKLPDNPFKPRVPCPLKPDSIEVKLICVSASKDERTWNENHFHIYIEVDTNSQATLYSKLPEPLTRPTSMGDNIYNVLCTLRYTVNVKPISKKCPGWSCRESQLTDVVRMSIVKKLNENREIVASGGCGSHCTLPCLYCTKRTYCNFLKLEWHWFLEDKAAELSRSCPVENKKQPMFADDGPFEDPVYYEIVTGIIQLPRNDGQLGLGEVFSWLFWKNFFFDWDYEYTFRRGSASYIGCTVIIRPSANPDYVPKAYRITNGTVAHVVCIFASMKEDFRSIEGKPEFNCCQKRNKYLQEEKDEKYGWKYLCAVTSREFVENCQSDNACENTEDSVAWSFRYSGTLIREQLDLSVVGHDTPGISSSSPSSLDVMFPLETDPNIPQLQMIPDPYEKKYCMILLIFWFLLASLVMLILSLMLRYKYERETFLKGESLPK